MTQSIWSKLFTALRGGASEVGESIVDQQALRILDQEIRDADTARIAVQSALTGHFVLSSLHGTDSAAALHRLLDMGIEAFLIASSVMGVIGQRLLRRICDSCKQPYKPDAEEMALFQHHLPKSGKTLFFHGAGCNDCSQTGYRDRIGVYELLKISPAIRQLVVEHATTERVRQCAIDEGMRPMIAEAIKLVDSDITTVAEVIRTLYVA